MAAGLGQFTIAPQFPGVVFTKISSGQLLNTGGITSVIVTLNEQKRDKLAASITLYTTVVVPTGNTDPLGKPETCDSMAPGQLSEKTGVVQFTTEPHIAAVDGSVILDGQEIKTGAIVSSTVISNKQTVEFREASVAMYLIVVVPTGKALPLLGPADCVMVTPGQLSVAMGAGQLTIALHNPVFAATVIFVGHVE
jgi:uncharacterized membrane protein